MTKGVLRECLKQLLRVRGRGDQPGHVEGILGSVKGPEEIRDLETVVLGIPGAL